MFRKVKVATLTVILSTYIVTSICGSCSPKCVCQGPNGTIAVCAKTDIASVPVSLSKDTSILTITGTTQNRFSLARFSKSDMDLLPNLVSLTVSFTELTTVDEDAFLDLYSLSRINLASNKLTTVQPNTFMGLRNLTFISLSNNPDLVLQDRVFYHLPQLRELYLSGLGITELRPAVFYGLENLRKLDLSSNRLTEFSPDVMVSMVNLWSLDLAFNQLQSLNPLLEPYVVNMRRLQLAGNDWQCNCLVKWLKKYPQAVSPPLTDPVTCANPTGLQYQNLHDIEDSLLTCEPPSIKNCPTQISVYVGETIRLRCLVSGDPYPVILWTFPDGSQVSSGSLPGIAPQDRADIQVPDAQLALSGKVTITAKSQVGFASFDIVLSVTESTTTSTTTTTTTASTTTTVKKSAPSTTHRASSISSSTMSLSSQPTSSLTSPASISTVLSTTSTSQNVPTSTPQSSTNPGRAGTTQQPSISTTGLPAKPPSQSGSAAPAPPQAQASASGNIVSSIVAAICGATALTLALILGFVLYKKLPRRPETISKVSPKKLSMHHLDLKALPPVPSRPPSPEILTPLPSRRFSAAPHFLSPPMGYRGLQDPLTTPDGPRKKPF